MFLLWCVELFLVVVFVCLGCFTFADCFEIRLMVALICWGLVVWWFWVCLWLTLLGGLGFVLCFLWWFVV